MIRLVVAVLFVALQGLGAAFAGAPADPSSSAPKQTPAEQAAPKAPAKDAAKEAAKSFPHADWKLRGLQSIGEPFGPIGQRRKRRNEHVGKKISFHESRAIGPELIIAVAPGLNP